MRNTFLTYLKNTLRLPEKSSVLLAVSGGIDSMVMLKLFEETSHRILVGHCNFLLRGVDADEDDLTLKNYCDSKNIPFVSIQFDTNKVAKERKISTQMAARELRFTWFEEIMETHKMDFLATAHHADDSLETALLNITRGTGLKGLKGILPKSGKLIRPILFADRVGVLGFAKQNKIEWREDSSNASTKYKRNFMRHKVIPLLKEQNPNVAHTFQNTSRRVASALQYIASQTELFKNSKVKEDKEGWVVSRADFFSVENRVLVEFWLDELKFNVATLTDIFEDKERKSAAKFLSDSYQLIMDRDQIFLSKLAEKADIYIEIDTHTDLVSFAHGQIKVERTNAIPDSRTLRNPQNAFLDFAKLSYPLILRNWQKGDRFRPFGMKGMKLVSDYLTDEKVPLHHKGKALVLCSGNDIVWLVGFRVANDYALNASTSSILSLLHHM